MRRGHSGSVAAVKRRRDGRDNSNELAFHSKHANNKAIEQTDLRAHRTPGLCGSADIPQLKEDITAGTMDCSGDSLPAFDLLGGMNAGDRDISLCLGRSLACFRNDQAVAGALSVIQGVQYLRRVPFPSSAPRERRHQNTILERTSAELNRTKEIRNHREERVALSMAPKTSPINPPKG